MGLFKRRTDRARPSRSRTACTPELVSLESRQLLFVGTISAIATPNILRPNGRYVPVIVTGSVKDALPPNQVRATFQVTDEYRRVEPRGRIKLRKIDENTYIFAFKASLLAQRSTAVPDGRHYYITIAVEDSDDGAGKTIPVIVPK